MKFPVVRRLAKRHRFLCLIPRGQTCPLYNSEAVTPNHLRCLCEKIGRQPRSTRLWTREERKFNFRNTSARQSRKCPDVKKWLDITKEARCRFFICHNFFLSCSTHATRTFSTWSQLVNALVCPPGHNSPLLRGVSFLMIKSFFKTWILYCRI